MRRQSERGATLVEYILFLSCFVLVSVTAVGGLNSAARSYFQQSSTKIGQPVNRVQYDANGNRQQQASTTSITAPPSTTTIAPTTTRATTTTVAPTTTAAPTTTRATTTTVAPTTTRATTTTTPPTTTIAKRVSTAIANTSTNSANGTWTFGVRVTVSGVGGATISGLTVSADGRYNGYVVGSLSCTTNSSGVCTMSYPGVPDSYSPIVFTISSVGGAAPWTGTTASITVYDP